jgi:hypothetical protein
MCKPLWKSSFGDWYGNIDTFGAKQMTPLSIAAFKQALVGVTTCIHNPPGLQSS